MMTCGVCDPEAFRPKAESRVLGYVTAMEMHQATFQARKLYFMGAELVFSDTPNGKLEDRPSWKLLSDPACLRDGDRLILSKDEDLECDPKTAQRRIEALIKRGVEVCVLKPEYVEADNAQSCQLAG